MSKKKEQEEKITIKRLFSNIRYCIAFAWKIDKKLIITIYGGFIVGYLISSIYDTLFLKYFIEMLSNHSFSMDKTLLFVVAGTVLMMMGQALDGPVEYWARARFIRVTGKIQNQFIRKASQIDLLCYDQKKYFEDFVIAASQSDEMILETVLCTGQMVGIASGIITLGTLIMTINPVIAIFPIAGFLINMITRFRITELEYDYDIEYKRLMRKADYSKRVFYQPEYAKEIKLSEIEVPLRIQFEEALTEIEAKSRSYGVKIAVLSLINWISVFTILSNACVPIYLGYLSLVKRVIALGDVAAMNNAQEGVRNALDGLNYALVYVQKAGQFAQRFRRFMDYKVQIENCQGSQTMPESQETLEIKDISFRYEGAKTDTLHHISMTVKPGEKIAIVGENGAGKTTFVKLLMRLYDVTEGEITYGGRDIRSFATKDYREHIGAVFQDFQLYGTTLAENVLMDAYAEAKEDEVTEALHLADFDRKLSQMPSGIMTEMTKEFSEEGTMLSGGETQKVAISRMFAKKGSISFAILDEPSSALDPLSEAMLTRNMLESAGEAAVIFISHRLSTTKDADHIYMFEEGRIIEEGTHEQLMHQNGKYAYMFEKQAHYYQDEIEE